MAALQQFQRRNFRTRWFGWKVKHRHAFVMPERIGHVLPVKNVASSPQRFNSVLSRLVVFAPGHRLSSESKPTLSGPADGRLPSKQEEVTPAESAAVRQKDPVDSLLDGVPHAYPSKLDRLAMRALCGEHKASLQPSIQRRTSPRGAWIFHHWPSRRFSLVSGALFSRGALVRTHAHLVLAKDHGRHRFAIVALLQESPAH